MPSLGPHVAMSAAVGVGTWAATGQEAAVPVAMAAGVLPEGGGGGIRAQCEIGGW